MAGPILDEAAMQTSDRVIANVMRVMSNLHLERCIFITKKLAVEQSAFACLVT
jgi:hypothetical protein